MQQEMFPVITIQAINDLLILAGTQSGNHHRLGFTPGEQRAAMSSRQNTNFRDNRTHCFSVPAVNALAGFDNILADNIFFDRF